MGRDEEGNQLLIGLAGANAYVKSNAVLGCETCKRIVTYKTFDGQTGLVEHHVHVAKMLKTGECSTGGCQECISLLTTMSTHIMHTPTYVQTYSSTDMFNLARAPGTIHSTYNPFFCPICRLRDEAQRQAADAEEAKEA